MQQLLPLRFLPQRAAPNSRCKRSAPAMPAVVQLLQLLLQQALGGGKADAVNDQDTEADAGLQQYLVSVLQCLQEAAVMHEVC